MALLDVAGSEGTVPPEQMVSVVPKPNVGVTLGVTVTEKVVVVAQSPAVGVNVYTPEERLLTIAGFQVPVMLLLDVVGSAGTVPPLHIVSDEPKLKVGVMFGFTVTFFVTVKPHSPGVGVKT
jgi:hypothetical protein